MRTHMSTERFRNEPFGPQEGRKVLRGCVGRKGQSMLMLKGENKTHVEWHSGRGPLTLNGRKK